MPDKNITRSKSDYEGGQMTGRPLEYYAAEFAAIEPEQISQRTKIPFDKASASFAVRVLDLVYRVTWPDGKFSVSADAGSIDPYIRILVLRYLSEGKYVEATGRYIAYNEIPWGNVYGANFQGRVIMRFLRKFGSDTGSLKRLMEDSDYLNAKPVGGADIAYSFDFMHGLPMKILIWEGDDEFPPSTQILYDETVVFGFTAEDIAVVGDILIERLGAMQKAAS
jgi:hypothetical protein